MTADGTLLDAVDALTKPDVLTRFAGGEHDHAWMELVRPVTPEERLVAKASKRKIGRSVKTGEWWCPFCEKVTTERPEGPVEKINRRDDPPLLDQLEARVRSSLSDGGSPSAGSASVLLDVVAFDLARGIEAKLRRWFGEMGASPGGGLSLRELLRSWYVLYIGGHHPVGDDDVRRRAVESWVTEVRDILDPPDQIPYREQPCPICGETRALRSLDGEVRDTVALWAVLRPEYRPEGSYGICRACNTVLAQDTDPIRLRARMNGAVAPASRLTQTVADAASSSAGGSPDA